MVDQFETLLNRSWRVPLTSSLLVDEQECLKLLDQMRTAVPEEIRQARRTLSERERLIAQAQEESQRIISMAREQAITSLDEREVMREAQSRADAIIADARREAADMRRDAERYAMQVLRDLSDRIERMQAQIENGIKVLAETPALTDEAPPPVQAPPRAPQLETSADTANHNVRPPRRRGLGQPPE